jgi:hypothetical protein
MLGSALHQLVDLGDLGAFAWPATAIAAAIIAPTPVTAVAAIIIARTAATAPWASAASHRLSFLVISLP